VSLRFGNNSEEEENMAQTVPVVSSPQAKIKSDVRVTTAEIDSC